MKNKRRNGFTLIELLVAMMVTSIILSAVASITYAISSATRDTDELLEKQARLRITKVRLTDLIRNSKMVCYYSGTDLAIWKSDNDADGLIDTDELVYIDAGADGTYLRYLEFDNVAGSSIAMSEIVDGSARTWLESSYLKTDVYLMTDCNNVSFAFDVLPPYSSFVNIRFDKTGPDNYQSFEINAKKLTNSSNLLNDSDEIISDDD